VILKSGYNTYLINARDVIYSLDNGGQVLVGNMAAAAHTDILVASGVTNVVNCTKNQITRKFKSDDRLIYMRFDICFWKTELGNHPNNEELVQFFAPAFAFIDDAIEKGNKVLIHCVAGAHRAGTMGLIYLIHRGECNSFDDALRYIIIKRPCVKPMGILLQVAKMYPAN